MKKLTQKQAWLHLAAIWSEPLGRKGMAYVHIPGAGTTTYLGLCTSIGALARIGKISTAINRSMRKKIDMEMLRRGPGMLYLWPWTVEGAKSRAAFCRKQAKLCSRRA